jgi:hypothetical protein
MEGQMTGVIRFPCSYTPEQVTAMTQAYEMACAKLGLVQRGNPVNELVGDKILQYGQLEKDPVRICELVVSDFKRNN